MTFSPKFNILPASHRTLWNELKSTPKHFVLYGGTALALRLGHRISEDFDFFSQTEELTGSRLATSAQPPRTPSPFLYTFRPNMRHSPCDWSCPMTLQARFWRASVA